MGILGGGSIHRVSCDGLSILVFISSRLYSGILLGWSVPAASFPQDVFPAPMVWWWLWQRCIWHVPPREVTCCSPSGAALFVLDAFQQFSMGLEPSKPSWVQKNSFTLCLMIGTRILIPMGSLAARPTLADPVGEKNPKTQDKDFFTASSIPKAAGMGSTHKHMCVHPCAAPHSLAPRQDAFRMHLGWIWGPFAAQ